ncbi:dethiobiotin synthase [Pseudonocardia sp. ICBG1293]|uniref:dethiobiotin synthase n=1 Tax=Pseudonocardia sp. ICBG1293 TaxID=2844382 RepID=UPI001CCE9AB3|nr:dethiobiotin synthase [Pseudonocardia sp. ICBG1293]
MTGRFVVVTGTGTGVGKTVATAALAAVAVAAGERVAVLKPAQTGVGPDDPGDVDEVARLVPGVTTRELARYPDPLAPATAARRCGAAAVTPEQAVATARTLADHHDLVLVEGAGGLLVRFTDDGGTLADVARLLDAPVVVVAAAGLGTLNHTELTVEALRARSLTCAGIVIGAWPATPDLAERCNLQDLPMITRVLVRGLLPEGLGRVTPDRFAAVARDTLGPIQLGDWQDPRA